MNGEVESQPEQSRQPFLFYLPAWLTIKPKITIANLEQERGALSLQERMGIERELRGVQDEFVETPELICRSLQLLENAVGDIPRKEAYETALFTNPEYVEDDDFRLAFLRADRFDANKAAVRMVKYWDRKVALFGTEKAFSPSVTVLHLSGQDHTALVKGGIRLLPYEDEAGRAIFFRDLRKFDSKADTMIRLVWFMVHQAIFDVENGDNIQKNGTIFLSEGSLPEDRNSFLPFDTFAEVRRYFQTVSTDYESVLPVRVIAIHLIPKNVIIAAGIERLLDILGGNFRVRTKVHDGTQTQAVLQELAKCGIPPESVPADLGGSLQFDYYEWLEERLMCTLDEQGISLDDILYSTCTKGFSELQQLIYTLSSFS